MKIKQSILFLIMLLLVLVFIIDFSNIKALATTTDNLFTGYSSNLSNEDLEKATTTTFFGDITYPQDTYTYETIGNNIDDSEPLLTVLVHGYGSEASVWSNDFEFFSSDDLKNGKDDVVFTYDPDSLIERLRRISNANVYYGIMDTDDSFELYKIEDLSENYKEVKEYYEENGSITVSQLNLIDYKENGEIVKQISDISNHTIVVFESNNPDSSNKYEYERLNYMIDKIAYDIKVLNQNKLPKINLISHSRGGLTVLQYALNHPELVNDVFTIGSPFLGSRLGTSEMLLSILYEVKDAGIIDILDQDLYMAYQERWNNNYENLYEDINFNSIGSYCSLEFVSYMAANDDYYVPDGLGIIIAILNEFKVFENSIIGIADLIAEFTDDAELSKAILSITDSMTIESIGDIFTGKLVIEDDIFIHLESQLGEGYKGFIEYKKCFEMDNCNLKKVAQANTAIPHNLEPRDEMILNYIIDRISLTGKTILDYEIYSIGENTIGIKNYFGDPQSNILSIPSVINNKQVVEIGKFAFSNIANKSKIDTVYIPTTVETIKQGAFYGCENINNIYFSTVSNVKYIHDSVFRNCISLLEIELPNSLIYLGDNCFYSCNNLNEITIDKNLSYLGSAAFAYCTIDNININNENSCYGFLNGILYDKNTNKLIYSNLETSSINIPSFITSISDYAFCGNNNISEIIFNNVEQIGDYAFINCVNLEYIYNDDKVCRVNKNAFVGTKWFNNSNFELIIGSVLLKYSDNEEPTYSVPTYIEYISDYAFHSKSLTEVIISETIELIGNSAFINCNNLKKVYLLDVYPPTIYSNSFPKNENLVIYVPGLYENDYKNNSYYSNYVNNIYSKWVTIKLYDGVNLYKSTALKYYSIIQNLSAPKKEGYEFIGWYSNITNKIYSEGNIFDLYDNNVTLTAVYEVSRYILYLNYNDPNFEMQSLDISYGEMIEFPVPIKDGYTFNGWYDGPNTSYKKYSDGNGNAIVAWDKCEDAVLYAIFDKNQYTILYVNNGGENSIQNPKTFYSDEVVILKNPTKYGYKFDGWIINGKKTNIIETGTYENITAVANWNGIEKTTNSSISQYVFSDQYIIVNIDNLSTTNDINFIIKNSVLQVTFICSTNKAYNAHIAIENRDLNLVINLKNIKFNAPDNYHAIDASDGEYTLYLNCIGENELNGGNGTENEKNGSYGIYAYKLIVNGGGISITGGNGYDGIDGNSGANGIDSDDNPDGWFLNPETGGNGTDGADGTDGTSGGNGGFAVYTTSTFAYSDCEAIFTGGNGGRGGNGGNGGNGGAGASDTSSNIFSGVGNPGNGGNGGNGANGGNSGVGSPAINTDFNLGVYGFDEIPGSKGLGGTGGPGGDAGSYGKDGKDGEDGKVGKPGYLEKTLYKTINCATSSESISYEVETQRKIFIELTVQCSGYYNIKSNSTYGTSLALYNENWNEIDISYILVNDDKDMLIYPYLDAGKYYIEVILSKNNDNREQITVTFDSIITNSSYVYLNSAVNILTHKHNEVQYYNFYASVSGFYYVKLSATSQYNVIYNEEMVQILYKENRIQKFTIEGYNNEALNVDNSNVIVFYAEKGKTYTIKIDFSDYTVDTLNLKICDFDPIEVYNNEYTCKESVRYGDNFKLWNVTESGTYNLSIDYSGTCTENIPFYILKLIDDNFEILEFDAFSYYNNERNIQFNVNEGDIIYFGYLNGTGNGTVVIQLEKYISETFELITDANENVSVGSEVLINGGSYGGHVITAGYTRIGYLSSSAPDTTSRLNYEWHSSNEEIAIVSDYGTITAICPGRVFITATYKNDNTIVGFIEIDVVPYTGLKDIYLNYGMDVRVGGTTCGTEVTSEFGSVIEVSNNPKVTIHVYKTRLICLGEDSPSASIQDFTWKSNNTNIATVSSYGTITAKHTGTVTITGTYKYNTSYKVVIVIEVIS